MTGIIRSLDRPQDGATPFFWKFVGLTFITCGIYAYYFLITRQRENNELMFEIRDLLHDINERQKKGNHD